MALSAEWLRGVWVSGWSRVEREQVQSRVPSWSVSLLPFVSFAVRRSVEDQAAADVVKRRVHVLLSRNQVDA